MEIKLRRFNKRLNSTKVPSNQTEWSSFQCYLRSSTSILTPIVVLENISENQSALITSYDYALINDFGNRYYFIKDIVSNNGLWTLYLDIDVLATYRDDIRNSTQYILRSTFFGRGHIIDGIYPTTLSNRIYIDYDYENSAPNYQRNRLDIDSDVVYRRRFQKGLLINQGTNWSVDRNYFNQEINNGGFIVGLLSDNGTGVTFYAMTRSVLIEFLNKIVMVVPSGTSDLSSGTARLLFNALQYIVSIKWYPALPTIVNQSWVTTINVGGNPITFDNYRVYDIANNTMEEFYFDIDIPKHPKTLSNSDFYMQYDYLNGSPYRQANLYFQPFGNIPIEVGRFMGYSTHTLRVNWVIDFTTGSVLLKLYTGDNELIYSTSSTIGVTLPVSNVSINDIGAMGIVGGYLALKSLNNKFTANETKPYMQPSYNAEQLSWQEIAERGHGNVDQMYDWTGKLPDIIEKPVDFGIDAIASLFGQVNTLGKPESYLTYFDVPFVYAWFQDIVQPDRYKFGVPRNENGLLDDFKDTNSFIKCANAHVDFTSSITSLERSRVISYLNSGFYME